MRNAGAMAAAKPDLRDDGREQPSYEFGANAAGRVCRPGRRSTRF
jgi:hypothetical protein